MADMRNIIGTQSSKEPVHTWLHLLLMTHVIIVQSAFRLLNLVITLPKVYDLLNQASLAFGSKKLGWSEILFAFAPTH